MEQHRNVLRQLKLRNQIRFLIYLYWLLFAERFYLLRHRPRARVHWLGHHRRPRRLERLSITLLFSFAVVLLEPREYVLWSAVCGGMAAIFVALHSIYMLIPRKREHWVS